MTHPTYFPNPVEDMKNWSAVLRSGKYPQGSHALQNTVGYCCLGVLVVEQKERAPEYVDYEDNTCYISTREGKDIRTKSDHGRAEGCYDYDTRELPKAMGKQLPMRNVDLTREEIQPFVPDVDLDRCFNSYPVVTNQGFFAVLNDQNATFEQIANLIDYTMTKAEEGVVVADKA